MSDDIKWHRAGKFASVSARFTQPQEIGKWVTVIPRRWSIEYYYGQTFPQWLKLRPRKLIFWAYYKIKGGVKPMRLSDE